MTTPDPYGRTTIHGKPLDNATAAAVRKAEAILGYELTIVQGIGGAVASAGTHLGRDGEGGRAIDLTTYDAARKIAVLESVGFIVWKRDYLPGVWGEHLHAILMLFAVDNDRGVAPAGFRQIAARLAGRDGLKGNRTDPRGPLRNPKPFTMEDYRMAFEKPATKPPRTRISRSIDRLVEAHHSIGQAMALLDDVAPSTPKRIRARARILVLRRLRRRILSQIEALKGKP